VGWLKYFRRARWDAERAAELQDYLTHEIDDNLAHGMSRQAAIRAAHRKLGNVTRIREEIYEMNTLTFLDTFSHDLRYGARLLLKSRTFSIAAILTLALGTGANAAVFSLVKAVLLTPLPYAEPDRRVMIWSRWVSFDKTWVSDQEIVDYRAFSQTMSAIAAWRTGQQNLTGDGEPLRVGVGFITANAFDVFGVRPLLGRVFTHEEDRPNGAPVAVLGYPVWQARYGGDPRVIGRNVLLDDVSVEIIGVMPAGFRLPTDFTVDAAEPTQLWRPFQMDMANLQRGSHGYYAAAILASGQTAASATEELRAMTRRLTKEGAYPEAMQFSAFAVSLDEEIRGDVRIAMWLLMGAVGFLLLIACVNVANLLLVRGDARLRELAMRTALGAAPERLMRQIFTESLTLALLGAALGLVVASAALRILVNVDPTSVPPLAPVRLDGTVIGYTLVLGVVTTLIFGLAPALRTLRVNLVESLREGSHQATLGGRRQRLRRGLVASELALAVMLMVGAGLMIRTLGQLGRIDLGFNPERLLTMRLALPAARYDTPEKVVNFYRQLTERVRTLPGAAHAGVIRALPLATNIGDWGLDIEGFEEGPGRNAKGDWQIVSDGAFEALGTRLLRGRWFTSADTSDAKLVAVINETMARTYWPDANDAVGGRLRVGNPRNPWVVVVGIVADERHNGVTGLVKEKFYIPISQWHLASGGSIVRNAFIVVRTTGDPLQLARPVRSEIASLDSALPVANIRPMREVTATALATPRLTGFLLSAFALLALALATVGVYGVLSYLVSQRTHEIGIRLALGADRLQVVGMILRQGIALAAIGIGAGLAGAFAVTRVMYSLLYQVEATDPLTFTIVPLTLLIVAMIASYLPALRAIRVPPAIALRTE
jgi:predicted permease